MTGRFSMEMILFAVDVSTPLNDVEMPEESFHESTERGGMVLRRILIGCEGNRTNKTAPK